jgi:tripartite-type tricarboxylate transporter receptor subunit TctC
MTVVGLPVLLAVLVAAATPALAQDFPNRPVRMIQPTAAGGPSDVLIRMVGDALSPRLGQPVIIENRPGAGGVIGAEAALKAPPDGYTILSVGNFLFTTAALRPKLPYDPVADFTGVSLLTRAPLVLVANPAFQPNTLAEVIAAAKTAPDGLTYTSPNFGGVPFLSGQLLMRAADIKLQHVTYSGSPAALVDVMAGRVPLMFDLWSSAKPYVESAQLKVIAIVSNERLPDAPQYPLMRETFPVFDFMLNNALVVAAQTPPPIVRKLVGEVHAVMAMPDIRERVRGLGMEPFVSTPEQYNELARNEVKKWTDLARANHISMQ